MYVCECFCFVSFKCKCNFPGPLSNAKLLGSHSNANVLDFALKWLMIVLKHDESESIKYVHHSKTSKSMT